MAYRLTKTTTTCLTKTMITSGSSLSQSLHVSNFTHQGSWEDRVKSTNLSMGLALPLASVLGIATAGCGGSSMRVLQSMTVNPATADAASTPDNKVQFAAIGKFSKSPSPAQVPFVYPYSGSWSVSNPKIATISQSGLAQCVPGAKGTVTVTATASANSATTGNAASIAVTGTAKLSCP